MKTRNPRTVALIVLLAFLAGVTLPIPAKATAIISRTWLVQTLQDGSLASLSSIAPTAKVPFKIMALYEDGTSKDITSETIVTAEDPSIASVGTDSTVTGHRFGTTNIKVLYKDGSEASGSLSVGIAEIEMKSQRRVVQTGEKLQFSLKALYGYSRLDKQFNSIEEPGRLLFTEVDASPQTSLSSSDPSTIRTEGNTIIGVKPGRADITATYGTATKTIGYYVVENLDNYNDPYKGHDISVIKKQRADGIAYLNSWRSSLGLQPLKENESMNQAAQAHGNYLALDGGQSHYESEFKPGFTGNTWVERMENFGYPFETYGNSYGDGGEEIAYTANENNEGVRLLIDSAPLHRIGLLDPFMKEVGIGINTGNSPSTVINLGIPKGQKPNPDDSAIMYYPLPGQTGLPTSWFDKETPNPLEPYGLYEVTVGYSATVSINQSYVEGELLFKSAVMTDQNGKDIPYYVTTGGMIRASNSFIVLTPKESLQPHTTYTVKLDAELAKYDGTKKPAGKTWSFTTGEATESSINRDSGKQPEGKQGGTPRFTDTSSHWARGIINWAVTEKIVNGYSDGTFQPDRNVTFSEFLSMLLRGYKVKLPDPKDGEAWYNPAWRFAKDKNWSVPGDMNVPVNRGQVARLLSNAAGKNYSLTDSIRYILDSGISNGKTEKSVAGYKEKDLLTRAEAVSFILNVMWKLKNLNANPVNEEPYDPIKENAPDAALLSREWKPDERQLKNAKAAFEHVSWDPATRTFTVYVPKASEGKTFAKISTGEYLDNTTELEAGKTYTFSQVDEFIYELGFRSIDHNYKDNYDVYYVHTPGIAKKTGYGNSGEHLVVVDIYSKPYTLDAIQRSLGISR